MIRAVSLAGALPASSPIALAYLYRCVLPYLREPGPVLAKAREAPAALLVGLQ